MNHHTSEELIQAEKDIATLWEAGELPFLTHLSGGNEEVLIEIFKNIRPGDYILGSHRAHYHFLLAGGKREDLIEHVKQGRSMFLFDRKLNFLTSSIVAAMAPIAAGIALGLRKDKSDSRVWCFLGDGAEDEGHFYEAVRFVDGRNLPCTFIIEDNDQSVTVPKAARYGKDFTWPSCVIRYSYVSPYPHAGSGCKHKIVFNPEKIKEVINDSYS